MDYIDYHKQSAKIRDIDPANDCLVYLCNRFELNMEQRYWLAFLYSTCYCGPTVFYMYNEFPDFERVDVGRLNRWWDSNKNKCVFQTDRLRIKTSNQFVPTFESYKTWVGNRTQQERFYSLKTPHPLYTWNTAEEEVTSIRNIGRFTSFIYLEMIDLLTDFKVQPVTIDWKNADNCYKGLVAASGKKTLSYGEADGFIKVLQNQFKKDKTMSNIYNIETTLCAYTKFLKGKRYVGYYIERQRQEIIKMMGNVDTGVCWSVLHDFRKETYKHIKNETW
jgi:hypothetical protein